MKAYIFEEPIFKNQGFQLGVLWRVLRYKKGLGCCLEVFNYKKKGLPKSIVTPGTFLLQEKSLLRRERPSIALMALGPVFCAVGCLCGFNEMVRFSILYLEEFVNLRGDATLEPRNFGPNFGTLH